MQMILDRVARQGDHLHVPLFELGQKGDQTRQFGGADRSEVGGVRKENAPTGKFPKEVKIESTKW